MSLSRIRPRKVGGGGKYKGRFDEGQLEFVRNVLAHTPDDTLIVMVMHIPINTFLDNEPYQNLQDRDAFFALFEGRRYTVASPGIRIRPSIIFSTRRTAGRAPLLFISTS